MHETAPHTTASDRATRHGHNRHTLTLEQGVTEPLTADDLSKPQRAADETGRAGAPIADLDEGDVLLHVLGTGLGPVFCAFVCEAAARLRLRGWARCESGALTIRAVGREAELANLVHEIRLHSPPDCSVRGIEPDAGDGGAPLPDHGFIPIVADFAGATLATGTVAAAGPDW